MTDIRALIIDSHDLEDYAELLPEMINGHYKERYLSLKLHQQKMDKLAAGTLLACFAGIGTDEKICCSTDGKPYVKGAVDFSISHSDGFTVLALCEKAPVGIDIERIGRVTSRIIKKVSQYDTSSATDLELAREWTRVEAALKQKGTGFYYDPMKLDMEALHFSGCEFREHFISCASGMEHSFSLELASVKVVENRLRYTIKTIFRKEI